MKTAEAVRKSATEQGSAEEEALQKGMEEKPLACRVRRPAGHTLQKQN